MKHTWVRFFREAGSGEGGGPADAKATKEAIIKELGTIKSALEADLTKKVDDQVEAKLKEKIDEINKSIKAVQDAPPEVTKEQLETMQFEARVTQGVVDKLQLQVKELSRGRGAGNGGGTQEDHSLKGIIAKSLEGMRENIEAGKIKKGDCEAKMLLKAVGDMSVVANVSTGVVPNTYRDGIVPPPFEMVHLRNLVAVTPSATDSYHFYRFSQGEGNINYQVQELATKAQIDEDLSEQTVNLDYLAGWLRISRKMLRNFSGLQAFLTRWLPEQYYQAEDTKGWQFILANATGVQDTSITGGFIQMIIRTIGKQKKARYNVNGIVVDGEVWANILTYKASGSGEFTMPIGVVSISTTGQLMICGIPVYTASWVGGDTAVIADWKYIEIIQSEALSLQFFEQDGTNVRENKITARIEASIGFAMLDPRAVVVANLAAAS